MIVIEVLVCSSSFGIIECSIINSVTFTISVNIGSKENPVLGNAISYAVLYKAENNSCIVILKTHSNILKIFQFSMDRVLVTTRCATRTF